MNKKTFLGNIKRNAKPVLVGTLALGATVGGIVSAGMLVGTLNMDHKAISRDCDPASAPASYEEGIVRCVKIPEAVVVRP